MNLKTVEIFKDLPDKTLNNIAKIIDEKKIEKGGMIFGESSPADTFCIVAEGQVDVFKNLPGGGSKTLAVLSAGEYFGEMSLFEDKPRIASVRAVTNIVLLEIKKNKFLDLIARDLDTGMKLLSAIMSTTLDRLSSTNGHLALLYDIGKTIASSKNIKEMTSTAFSNILKQFPKAGGGLIAVYSEFTNELEIHFVKNIDIKSESLELGDPFVKRISSEKEILDNDINFANEYIKGKSIIASAFYSEEQFLGFMVFTSAEKNSFKTADLILLSSASSLISISIRNIAFVSEEKARKRLEETKFKEAF